MPIVLLHVLDGTNIGIALEDRNCDFDQNNSQQLMDFVTSVVTAIVDLYRCSQKRKNRIGHVWKRQAAKARIEYISCPHIHTSLVSYRRTNN